MTGYLFDPGNVTLVTLFRNLGLRNLRIGGGSVDTMTVAGTGSDGYTGIDKLFAFAAAAGVKVIYSLRLLNPAARPIPNLTSVDAQIAGHIWACYREQVASFAIGNEPDWHSYHTYPGHPLDPAITEAVPGVPGSAYRSYLADWQRFASAVSAAAPGVVFCGPDTGAYSTQTYTPSPASGVSWTQQFAIDLQSSGTVAEVTQHHYAGGGPGQTTAQQAISNMLSVQWVTGTAPGTQPAGTTYTPYPWLYRHNCAPTAPAGLRYRLTEANDYLTGVPGASNGFASALWALDYLHWWATRGAAGVNFHNKQWLYTDTIVPDAAAGSGYAVTPKGYGIKAFDLGSAGRMFPVAIANPGGVNATAYCVRADDCDYVTVINKTQGVAATDAAVTITPPFPGPLGAEAVTLVSGEPGNPGAASARLGGATITGAAPWNGTWSAVQADPQAGVCLTVQATSAAVVRIHGG
ncbi:MAG: hypothetical protein ACM32E_09205 [Gemmatimonadota bacterium]